MDLTATFDFYCERVGPSFWAEPANAITNAAFLIAAVIGWNAAAQHRRIEWGLITLVVITGVIGVGSFLFHTFATGWALLADIIPIQLFILVYFALAMRRFAGFPWWGAVLATAAFVAGSAFGGSALEGVVGDHLNGSEGYIPPLLALLAVGAVLMAVGRGGPGIALVVASIIFAVSLTFRTIDEPICQAFPLGTHFLWHTLNGVLLGWLIVAMARFSPARPAPA